MKNYFRFGTVASLLILSSFSIPAFSQDSLSSPAALAEKVYLQLDHTVYTTDQTIWFKAIVAEAGTHIPSERSGVLYVELIDAHQNIVERKLIKLVGGIGDGFFQLSPAYSDGSYLVRAYTEWDKNFGSGFYFTKYITVSGTGIKPPSFDPIKQLTIQQRTNGERFLNVMVDPSISDSISGKGLQFVVQANGKNDTLSVKRNRSNQYLLDYAVPAQTDLVTLQIASDNEINYSKTIVVDTNSVDLQFLPESGELVEGLSGFLGVKALDYEGRGRKVEGEIVNTKGEIISRFTTNELGMGTVSIGVADSNAHYIARLVGNKASGKNYSLPAVATKGNSLSVKKIGEKIMVRISSNYLTNDSIVLRSSCRGVVYFDFSGKLHEGMLDFSMDKNLLPEGIIDFTLLLTKSRTPVAERLYFNEGTGERLRIDLSMGKMDYAQREEAKVNIATLDEEGDPVPANLSVLALNGADAKEFSVRQNILSYFLLSSDLKGNIENPGYYFQPATNRFDDLDALLLTQGWRKYNYAREQVRFTHDAERAIVLSGIVRGGLSEGKIIKGAELTLMGFSKPPFFSSNTTDNAGQFRFELEDVYGDNIIDVLIQSASESGKKKQYSITLDKKDPPPIDFLHAMSVRKPDSVVQASIQQNIERKKAEDAYRLAKDGSVLKEVVVSARSLSPQQKEVTDKYGKAEVVISGKQIQAKEEKWSYGLYSVLLFQFPDKVKITRYPSGFLYASLHNSEPTLVVIDGIPVKSYEYNLIPIIPPSEVKSFELIPYAKNFHSLFCEAIYCGFSTPSVGNVIAIYTHAGKGIYGVTPPRGISKMTTPVYATPREFYAPKYEQLKPEDWQKPDLRTTVHWAPKLITDTKGRSTVSFYNADGVGPVKVIVEAISADGEVGYSELEYEVKKKNPEAVQQSNQ